MVQKYKNTQWTRVDWSQIEVTAKPEDVKATWRAQIPGDVWLTPNYAYLQKCPKLDNPKKDKSIIDRRKFKLIIMDETDRAIADSLTDFQPSPLALTEKSETGMSEKSIDWLLSFSWFYQIFQEVQKGRRQKKKKQFYVRVIPEVDIGNDRVEEPRVLTDEIFEFLHVARIQQGESENQNIQRQIRTDLKLCKGALHTITLPELYDIMEKFDIDKSQFTLIDDPVHMISMEDCARTGVPVKTFSAEGEPIMSHSQAMLYMIQSLICGFQWSTATPAARENWADYIRKCRWSWPANCYLEVKDVLHQIMFLKQQKRAAFEKQIKMKEYLILGVNGDQYLKSSKAYKTYAQQIGLPENAFVGKCAPIWTLRIHSVYSALDHFVTDLEDCDMIKRLTVEGIFSMMPVQHKGMFTEYFNGANKTLDAAEEIPTTSIDSEDFQKTPESPKSPEKMSEDSQDVQEALGFLDKIQKTSEDSESSDAKEEEDLLKETLELEALLKEMDPDDDSESYSNPEIETTVIQKPEESVATVIQNTVIQDNVELPKTEESLDGILEKLMKLEISATVIPSATVTQMTPSESGVLNLQMSNDSEDVDAVGTMTTVPSPSSVPDDPSYSNPIDAEQLRMEIEEKNARIEELELLNKQLLERAEHMGQLLRYKVKHHEEIIDKFMKRMTAENKD
ncbi:Protein CBG24297 [Caenorhabditis briggsae]|uniref:Protein CBG24297 n=1 Tax=Caenorhabditis briggsae TaxID=6238 RepID=A8WKE5_CAEBR|nr:Protein CBG24297 [Caenorhabditis briggsae]CAP20940.2 Protein CBG24297 [Caenorhabditis briggsae]